MIKLGSVSRDTKTNLNVFPDTGTPSGLCFQYKDAQGHTINAPAGVQCYRNANGTPGGQLQCIVGQPSC